MSCRNLTVTNGNPSILEQKIQEIEGREDVDNLLAYFRTPSFMGEFGDYVTAYNEGTIENFGNRIDENGEPNLIYNDTAKKYYYIDKKGEKIYFPIINRGLRGIFNYKKLEAITSQLALSYFQDSVTNDFNDIDFTEAVNLPSLKPFLKQKIEAKIAELNTGNFNQKVNAKVLNKTLDFLDEWVENVDAFYKKIGLNRKDNLDEAEDSLDLIQDDLKDPIFNKASFERDSKESVTTNVKLRLSLLKDNTNIDPIWNEPAFVKFDETYSTILQKLSGNVAIIKDGVTEDIFEIFKDEIQKIVARKPYFQTLIDYLQSDKFTENDKNEFTQAFNLHKNNFLVSEISNNEGKFKHSNRGVSDSGSKASIALTQWDTNFRTKFLDETNNITDEGVQELNSYVKELKILNKLVSAKDANPEEDFELNTQEFVEILNKIGVEVTEKGFTYYIEDEGVNQFDFTKQSAKLITTISNTLKALDNIRTNVKKNKSEEDYVNPFATQSVFKEMAKAEAFYVSEGSDASIFTGGKSKWLYSYPSYLSTKVLSWKKDRSLLVEALNKSEYTKGSELMKWLLAIEKPRIDPETESAKRLKNFNVGVFTTMQESGKVDSKTGDYKSGESKSSSEISQNDYFIDHVNKVLNNDFVRTTTPADKTTDMQIKTGMFISTFGSATSSSVIVNEKTQRIFLNYFLSEFNRMRSASMELDSFQDQPEKLKVHYHYKKGSPNTLGNAFKSQYFQDLSFNSKSKDPLVLSIKELLYEKNGHPKMYDNLDINDGIQGLLNGEKVVIKDLINDYIVQELSKGILNTAQLFRNQGIIAYDSEGNTVNRLIAKDVFDESYKGTAAVVSAISDYYINSLIQNIEYSKMFSGDVAFYKDMVDYKKRIPATYTDGLQLRLQPGEENFNIAIINAVDIPSPFIKELEKMLGKEGANPYRKINSSDAQAWITPDRWKFLVQRLGKWSKTHDSLYEKMISENDEAYTEKELKIAAQPLKGVYFELNGATPVYLKYSQAVLTKRLVQGSPLEKIYNKMVLDENGNQLTYNDQIHEVITLDGIKVGSPTPTDAHNIDGSVKDKFTFNKISLKNSGWKLQQDLPTKTFKETEVGSQIQKNIFGGLLNNRKASFILDGGIVTGQDIINELVKTTKALSDKGVESLKREFGINEQGQIKNVEGFYNSLIDELIKRGGSKNIIDALRKEIALYGIPQAGSKIINVFSSIVTKRTVKIKTNGGSFIQMSNFGMNYEQGTKQGVIWAPDALSTTNEPYLYKDPISGRNRVKPGGILISGSFIAKYIPNYREYNAEQLFGQINPETGKREGGIIDGRITEQLIGYRIPNQGLASNDALRIVGILPEENGDTVVAYTGITTKTGSDFDVDKMYIMFPSFKLENDILSYIATTDDSLGGLQNRLIELYQSVLTHPEVIKDVMKPVDIDFVKNDIVDLIPPGDTNSLYHFDSWNDIQLLYDFRGGKAGVGQEANAVVDINREGFLTLNDYYIGWGHMVNGETKLDEEFAQALTSKDLKEYLIDTNNVDNKDVIAEIKKPRVADTLTAILNGFVDIAKDPFITRGNWVTITTNVGNLLIRSGMHPLYVTAFMAQPILRDFVAYQNSLKSLISNDHGDMEIKFKKNIVSEELIKENDNFPNLPKSLLQIYEKFVSKDKVEADIFTHSNIKTMILKFLGKDSVEKVTSEELTEIIKIITKKHSDAFTPSNVDLSTKSLKEFRDQIKNKRDNGFQSAVLAKFLELQQISKNIRENVNVAKVDTNGNGKNINSLFAIANMKQHILSKERSKIKGALKGFGSKLNNTILGVYYDNSIINTMEIVDANPSLFPQGQKDVQQMFNDISKDLYNTPATNEDMMSRLEDEYRNFTMSKFFDLSPEESRDLILNLPNRFEEFRKENRGKYLIIDELQIKNSGGVITKFIGLNNRKKSPDFEATFIDSWRDLQQDNPKLAEDLIKYSYVTSGFNITPNQFFTYIPHEYFIENNFNDFIIRNTIVDQSEFIDKFYLNNSADNRYIYKPDQDTILIVDETISKDGKAIPTTNNGFLLKVAGKARTFVNYKGKIYKREGYTRDREAVYIRTQPLGYSIKGNYIVEYGEPFLNETEEFKSRNEDIINNKSVQRIKENIDLAVTETMKTEDYFELQDEIKISKPIIENNLEPSDYINHSGGAKGGDTVWNDEGIKNGFINHNHYTTDYYNKLSDQNKQQLNSQYLEVTKFLGRGRLNADTYAGQLVRRDMIQANRGDAIYGVTELVFPNFTGRKGYLNTKSYSIPEGGTGYALARGIILNKPVYVFNQSNEYGNEVGWYTWNNKSKNFIKSDTPILTRNFTGIGSTQINELGVNAIKEVYANTLESKEVITPINTNISTQLNLFNQPDGLPAIDLTDEKC